MHEMAVTQGLLNMALEHAQGHRITAIYLKVGQMAAVVPDSVELFFDYLSKGTPAEGARLHFERVPIAMGCQDCGAVADLSAWRDELPPVIMAQAIAHGCAQCDSKRLRVTDGVSFGLVSLEVEEDGERSA